MAPKYKCKLVVATAIFFLIFYFYHLQSHLFKLTVIKTKYSSRPGVLSEHIQPIAFSEGKFVENTKSYNSSHKHFEKFIKPTHDDFQKVDMRIKEKFYVYSAYLDFFRNKLNVRVLGADISHSNRTVFCQFINKYGISYSTVRGKLETTVTAYSYRLPYSPIFIICPVNETKVLPSYVSITVNAVSKKIKKEKENKKYSNILIVHNPYNETIIAEFAVCVQPMYNLESPFEILEWIEYYKMMGVEHFTFYNMSAGPHTSLLLKSYGDIVTILPWSTPYKFQKEMVMYAQFLQANDCNFRYRGRANYLILLDFDEFLIPYGKYTNNFKKLFKYINTQVEAQAIIKNPKSILAEYQFKTAYYFTSWDDDEESSSLSIPGNPMAEEIALKTRMWTKTKRMEINPFSYVSKVVSKPTRVVEPGIHVLEKAVDNGFEIEVPSEYGYVYHYRVCTDYEHICNSKTVKTIRDAHAHTQFATKLAIRMAEKLKNLTLLGIDLHLSEIDDD